MDILLVRLACCCLLLNTDYETNSFNPKLDLKTKVIRFGDGQTGSAALITFDDMRILVFRGTIFDREAKFDTFLDWTINLQSNLVTHADVKGMVHAGFKSKCENLLLAKDTIQQKSIEEHLKLGQGPLYVTGHSQGGAVAILAAAWLHSKGHKVQEVVTFAAPRLGNAEFCKVYSDALKVRRYEFNRDLVPLVPLSKVDQEKLETNFKRVKTAYKVFSFGRSIDDKFAPWDKFLTEAIRDVSHFEDVGKLCLMEADQTEIKEAADSRWRHVLLPALTNPKNLMHCHFMDCYLEQIRKLK